MPQDHYLCRHEKADTNHHWLNRHNVRNGSKPETVQNRDVGKGRATGTENGQGDERGY